MNNENELFLCVINKIDIFFKYNRFNVHSIRDCHKKYFHTFEYKSEYDFKLTNISNNEIINVTISDKSMGLYELNQNLAIAR